MARTQIPGWVFVILGIIVDAVSYFANKKTAGKFIFFIIIGSAFIVYGAAKYFLNRITKKERIQVKHVEKKQPAQIQRPKVEHYQRQNVTYINEPQMQRENVSNYQQQPRETVNPRPASYCPNCGNTMQNTDNFCSRCGLRMR